MDLNTVEQLHCGLPEERVAVLIDRCSIACIQLCIRDRVADVNVIQAVGSIACIQLRIRDRVADMNVIHSVGTCKTLSVPPSV